MDDDHIAISGLQHYVYCPRQFALIHVEQLWAENKETAEGRVLHEHVDGRHVDSRRAKKSITSVPISNPNLGIYGVADRVDFVHSGSGLVPVPVEYKRGKPKRHRADEIQLCAQALCLEWMLQCDVSYGELYYGSQRRLTHVPMDAELREATRQTIKGCHDIVSSGRTPMAEYSVQKCGSCSLNDLCQPKLAGRSRDIARWIATTIGG